MKKLFVIFVLCEIATLYSCVDAFNQDTSPSTIILPDLPHLEWMTENLSGYGGTEIDGHTYYTWEEAMAAVKQLGDGWRLPEPEEWEALNDLGSEWRENGPHGLPGRLFGGGLFLEAAGIRSRHSGDLVGGVDSGHYWSCSAYGTDNTSAGYLGFGSGGVTPLNSTYRAHGLSVRCIRSVK